MNDTMATSLLKAYVNIYRRLDPEKRYVTKDGLECIETVLDLVEKQKDLIKKQQKEIEDLKEITQNYNAIGGETFGDDRIIVCSMKYFYDGYFKKNYITKDKIREKIKKAKEINWHAPKLVIEYFEELLEEN